MQERYDKVEIKRIEDVVTRWLLSLDADAYQPPLIAALQAWLYDGVHPTHQRAALMLLTSTLQAVVPQPPPPLLIKTFLSSLLALTNLPAVASFQLDSQLTATHDPTSADLALLSLSLMGNAGPAGLMLAEVRDYFQRQPALLHTLARYSLEHQHLLTLTVVPQSKERFQRYSKLMTEWQRVLKAYTPGGQRRRASQIETVAGILRAMLECAEEVRYPISLYLLEMLKRSGQQNSSDWQNCWQDFLAEQLQKHDPVSYQNCVFLWLTLFPTALEELTALLHSDLLQEQRYSQQLLASLSLNRIDLRGWLDLLDLRDLEDTLLTPQIAEIVLAALPGVTDTEHAIDLCAILAARLDRIHRDAKASQALDIEVEKIRALALQYSLPPTHPAIREVAQMALSRLPVRNASEIERVVRLAKTTSDLEIRQAYTNALARTNTQSPENIAVLEKAQQSTVMAVSKAAQAILDHKRKQDQALSQERRQPRR